MKTIKISLLMTVGAVVMTLAAAGLVASALSAWPLAVGIISLVVVPAVLIRCMTEVYWGLSEESNLSHVLLCAGVIGFAAIVMVVIELGLGLKGWGWVGSAAVLARAWYELARAAGEFGSENDEY